MARIVNRVEAYDVCRHIAVFLPMRLDPRLSAAQSGLLGTRQDDADLRMFQADTNGNALDLDRVVFITGGYTTGSAEWMIHSLQHTMGKENVILIGEWTAGQNVMTAPVATDFHMTLYPVVANVCDASGDNDYPKGIEPTFLNNESSYVYLYEYGSLDEILLLDALYTLFNLGEE